MILYFGLLERTPLSERNPKYIAFFYPTVSCVLYQMVVITNFHIPSNFALTLKERKYI